MPLLPLHPPLQGGALLAKLHALQEDCGYLSLETLDRAARELGVPLSQLYSAAIFYSAFSFQPRGLHTIRVCMGTACHIRGGENLHEQLEALLGIKVEETTADRQFTLETVRCVGSCSMSPVIQIDGDTRGRLRPDRLAKVLQAYVPLEAAGLEAKGEEA